MNKVKEKLYAQKCFFCGEDDPVVLDVHRITEGCNGGKYEKNNTIVVCANCHRRLHHSDKIKIVGWTSTTNGRKLHCFINNEEQFL